jgi:hypothetical protein
MQHPDILNKNTKSQYKKKEIKTPSGKTIYLQGYEPQAYKLLLNTYIEDEIITDKKEVPEVWWEDDTGKLHRYFVDFYIPKDKLMVEIKSLRTYSIDERKEKIQKTKNGRNCN